MEVGDRDEAVEAAVAVELGLLFFGREVEPEGASLDGDIEVIQEAHGRLEVLGEEAEGSGADLALTMEEFALSQVGGDLGVQLVAVVQTILLVDAVADQADDDAEDEQAAEDGGQAGGTGTGHECSLRA